MNLRSLGYEPSEMPCFSIPRLYVEIIVFSPTCVNSKFYRYFYFSLGRSGRIRTYDLRLMRPARTAISSTVQSVWGIDALPLFCYKLRLGSPYGVGGVAHWTYFYPPFFLLNLPFGVSGTAWDTVLIHSEIFSKIFQLVAKAGIEPATSRLWA